MTIGLATLLELSFAISRRQLQTKYVIERKFRRLRFYCSRIATLGMNFATVAVLGTGNREQHVPFQ